MIYRDEALNVSIKADSIDIGENVTFGRNIDVRLRGSFEIGDRSRLGDDVEIRGNSVRIGSDLFHSRGLRVGGGGRQHPRAKLTIGSRCTIHNNFINVCEEVHIGDDVGLSPECAVLTHGYWQSVLEGYPARFAGVAIGNGVIVGYRSVIMMGVTIGENTVVGAQSVVTKNLDPGGIYAGNPARFIRHMSPPSVTDREQMVEDIVEKYREIAAYHEIAPTIVLDYPWISVNNARFHVETLAWEGVEDDETDDFRDYVRKWGLRFYTGRPFKSLWRW